MQPKVHNSAEQSYLERVLGVSWVVTSVEESMTSKTSNQALQSLEPHKEKKPRTTAFGAESQTSAKLLSVLVNNDSEENLQLLTKMMSAIGLKGDDYQVVRAKEQPNIQAKQVRLLGSFVLDLTGDLTGAFQDVVQAVGPHSQNERVGQWLQDSGRKTFVSLSLDELADASDPVKQANKKRLAWRHLQELQKALDEYRL